MSIDTSCIPTQSFDAIIFDCDGTLSAIEGVDELARMNGVGDRVAALTEHAMSTGALSQSLYQQRLDLIRPTRRQVEALTQRYRQQVTPNVVDVIRLLQQLDKTVYVLSAGMNPAVVNLPPG